MAILKEIYILTGQDREWVDRCVFMENHGIEGDGKAGPGNRQVAFSSKNAGRDGGMCGSRYGANLVFEGMDFPKLRLGMKIQLGEAVLRLSILGKECYPDCPIVKAGKSPCYLKRHCGFFTVETGGKAQMGDAALVLSEE